MSDKPQTKSQARRYRYGKWAGHPEGNAYDESRCAYSVWNQFSVGGHQCSKKPGYGPDGLYCRVHAKKVVK